MKRRLEHLEIPGEHEARERTWRVVSAAFGELAPSERRPLRRLVPALAFALTVGAAAAATATSPGRALVHSLRESIGVRRAQPALFSLPASGRLLVASGAGVWVVQADGSKRLLGSYHEGAWSPFGRFVAAVRANELVALEPDGRVRWSLARPGVRRPRWEGTRTDTRIAYLDRTGLRLVAGDGTGDHLLAAHASGPLAWRPGTAGRVLGYVAGTQLRIEDVTSGRVVARNLGRIAGRDLVWSPDGQRAVVVGTRALRVVDVDRRTVRTISGSGGGTITAAAFSPDGKRLAVLETGKLLVYDVAHGGRAPWVAFVGPDLRDVAWSPDGGWLVTGVLDADQWVFVDTARGRVQAVSAISAQFRSQAFPAIEGWCCARR